MVNFRVNEGLNLQKRLMLSQIYQQARFLTSAAKLSQLPADRGFEVAFAGRSNAGKSTALNVLTQQRQLARTSKTPGRTQLINLFELDDDRRLVDLPGYGYAKVPEEMKRQWQETLARYLETRDCLRGLILLMDCRHPLQELDCVMLNWAIESELPTHILLTKADKLKRGAAMSSLQKVRAHLKQHQDSVSVQLFSGLKRTGVDELANVLNTWYEIGSQTPDI